jgi:uncharacterized protein (TIGR02757 family)
MAWSNPEIGFTELKSFLDEKAERYNAPDFIDTDPIQVPHQYSHAADIEISAFLTATLAWGQKLTIIRNATLLLSWMPGGPYEFIMNAGDEELRKFLPFVHRTFNGIDCIYFMKALGNIYRHHGGLRELFESEYAISGDLFRSIVKFREVFFQAALPGRTAKHLANIDNGSSGKRLNMFLRWMVRRDSKGVDFGIWDGIPMHALFVPLDVHSGTVARKLGLLERKQNDWKAVTELTGRLREFDPEDPVRYDFALFGLGSFEKF